MYAFKPNEHIKRGAGKIIPLFKSAELKRIKGLAHRSPDVREDVVSHLRDRILGGRYEIESEQVAERIIQHGLYMLGALGQDDSYRV